MSSSPSEFPEEQAMPEMGMPTWFANEVLVPFQAAVTHGFILAGDVWGFTIQGIPQRRFLQDVFGQKRVVAYYNRATGITFPLPSMRQKALAWVGESGEQRSQDPMTAALNATGVGATPMGDVFSAAQRPLDVLATLDALLRSPQGKGEVAVILDYAELLCPVQDNAVMSSDDRLLLSRLLWWGQDEQMAEQENFILLLARKPADLHANLRASGSGYKLVDIPLPTLEDRRVFLEWYLQDQRDAGQPIELVDVTLAELANLTAGLTLRHLGEILLYGAISAGVTRLMVKARKDEIISAEYTDVAEMIDPLPGGFTSLGGMEQLNTWTRMEVIEPILAGRLRDVPKGILLVGPPGTGKTYWVKALAAEIGFNAVMLKTENILGSLVGQSEQKLKQFLTFARALAPVLIFMDELDQSDMARRGNGSGNPVASNLFGQLLQFTSDEALRGQVVVIFASNRPDLIDDALKRLGRIDAIVPVLLANAAGRREIICAQARTQETLIADDALEALVAGTERYSAADLAAVVSKARRLAVRRQGIQGIELPDAQSALRLIRAATPQIADRYTRLALEAVSDLELLPQESVATLSKQQTQPEDARLRADPPLSRPPQRGARNW